MLLLFVVSLWLEPSKLATVEMLKVLVAADVVEMLPVLVIVALLAELSAKGVAFNGRFRTAAAVVCPVASRLLTVNVLLFPLLSVPSAALLLLSANFR